MSQPPTTNRPVGIVQGHSLQRSFLEELLKQFWSNNVYRYSSFSELNEVLENQRFGLVFCEVSHAQQERLPEYIRTWDVPVIGLLSNETWTVEEFKPYLEAGLADFLSKPYQPGEIEILCDRWKKIQQEPTTSKSAKG